MVAWLVGGCGVLAFVALVFAYWGFTVDDSFILLRYADNVTAGLGPTWNASGERAEGYTSPLWMLVLSLALRLHVPGLLAAKGLGVAAMAGALGAAAVLAARLSEGARARDRQLSGALCILLLGMVPTSALHAVSGMETALAALLATAFAVCLLDVVKHASRARCVRLAGLGLLLSLTRPELNAFVLIAVACSLRKMPRPAQKRLIGSVLLIHGGLGAAYFAWRLHYYGMLLPLPFYVKALLPGGVAPGAPHAIDFAKTYLLQRPDLALGLLVMAFAGRRAGLGPMLIAMLCTWVLFFFPEHQMGFDFRYFEPMVPLLFAVASAGLVRVQRALPTAPAAAVPVLSVCIGVFALATVLPGSLEGKLAYGAGIERAHAKLGRHFAALRPQVERPVLAALDCGAIAYYSRWHVIDTWGLNEPSIARTRQRDAERVLAAQPTVLVVVSRTADRFDPHFDYERALWNRARELGYEHVSTLEFMPDYFLFSLALPGPAQKSLVSLGSSPADGAQALGPI